MEMKFWSVYAAALVTTAVQICALVTVPQVPRRRNPNAVPTALPRALADLEFLS